MEEEGVRLKWKKAAGVGLLAWKEELRLAWCEFYKAFSQGSNDVESEYAGWLALSLASEESGPIRHTGHLALEGLRPSDASSTVQGVSGGAESLPFGLVRRTLEVNAETASILAHPRG